MSKQRESTISKKITDYLDELIGRGLPFYYEHRSGTGGFNYKKGVPDLWFTFNGIHYECEIKTQDGNLSPMQEKFKYRCINIFHNRYINPHSFEEFKLFVDSLINEVSPH